MAVPHLNPFGLLGGALKGTLPNPLFAGQSDSELAIASRVFGQRLLGSLISTLAGDSLWDAKGDLAVGTGANAAGKLSVGTNTYVLTADSAESLGMKWAPSAGGGVNRKTQYEWVHDFEGLDDLNLSTSGLGSFVSTEVSVSPASDGTHPGVALLSCGTTSVGYASLSPANLQSARTTAYVPDSDDLIVEMVVKLNAVPDGTNTYSAYFGLTDQFTSPANIISAVASYSGGAALWRLNNMRAGASTTVNTAITPTTNWVHLKLVITSSSVEFYIDGTLEATESTAGNIPIVSIPLMIGVAGSAGSSNTRGAHVDLVWIHKVFSSNRNAYLSTGI